MATRVFVAAGFAVSVCFSLTLAQNPCDDPVPGNCRVPDTCCILPTGQCPFVPGDINNSGHTNGIDVLYLVRYDTLKCSVFICPDTLTAKSSAPQQ